MFWGMHGINHFLVKSKSNQEVVEVGAKPATTFLEQDFSSCKLQISSISINFVQSTGLGSECSITHYVGALIMIVGATHYVSPYMSWCM